MSDQDSNADRAPKPDHRLVDTTGPDDAEPEEPADPDIAIVNPADVDSILDADSCVAVDDLVQAVLDHASSADPISTTSLSRLHDSFRQLGQPAATDLGSMDVTDGHVREMPPREVGLFAHRNECVLIEPGDGPGAVGTLFGFPADASFLPGGDDPLWFPVVAFLPDHVDEPGRELEALLVSVGTLTETGPHLP